jgi:hypothetical protein
MQEIHIGRELRVGPIGLFSHYAKPARPWGLISTALGPPFALGRRQANSGKGYRESSWVLERLQSPQAWPFRTADCLAASNSLVKARARLRFMLGQARRLIYAGRYWSRILFQTSVPVSQRLQQRVRTLSFRARHFALVRQHLALILFLDGLESRGADWTPRSRVRAIPMELVNFAG